MASKKKKKTRKRPKPKRRKRRRIRVKPIEGPFQMALPLQMGLPFSTEGAPVKDEPSVA